MQSCNTKPLLLEFAYDPVPANSPDPLAQQESG